MVPTLTPHRHSSSSLITLHHMVPTLTPHPHSSSPLLIPTPHPHSSLFIIWCPPHSSPLLLIPTPHPHSSSPLLTLTHHPHSSPSLITPTPQPHSSPPLLTHTHHLIVWCPLPPNKSHISLTLTNPSSDSIYPNPTNHSNPHLIWRCPPTPPSPSPSPSPSLTTLPTMVSLVRFAHFLLFRRLPSFGN